MRPLPLEPLPGAPEFVRGVSVIRDAVVPVVHASRLLEPPKRHTPRRLEPPNVHTPRLVLLRVEARPAEARRVALAVEAVIGVHEVADDLLVDLPPLLADANDAVVEEMAALNRELLVVLNAARLVPEPVWALLDTTAAS